MRGSSRESRPLSDMRAVASRGRSAPCRLGADHSATAPEEPDLLAVQQTWGQVRGTASRLGVSSGGAQPNSIVPNLVALRLSAVALWWPTVVAQGTWTHIPVLHGEIENRVYWREIYKQRDSGVPSCRCPIAGQQAPWPALQERGGLRRALPLQLQHGLQHERKEARSRGCGPVSKQLPLELLAEVSLLLLGPARPAVCYATRWEKGMGLHCHPGLPLLLCQINVGDPGPRHRGPVGSVRGRLPVDIRVGSRCQERHCCGDCRPWV